MANKKISIYRTIGWFLLVFSGLGAVVNICGLDKFQRFLSNPVTELFPSLFGIVSSIGLNPLLWLSFILLWRADRNENPKIRSKWVSGFIVLSAFIIVFVGVLIGKSIQLKNYKAVLNPRHIYHPEDKSMTMKTIDGFVDRMQNNNQSKVYFEILQEADIAAAKKEILELIVTDSSKETLFYKLGNMQGEMESRAVNLTNKNIPDDFYNNPDNYPELSADFIKYFYGDFKMSLLAYIYYTVYDRDFKFQYSVPAQEAAKRINEILMQLGEMNSHSN